MFLNTIRQTIIPILLTVFLVGGGVFACTTNDAKSETEGELDSELDDLSDSGDKIDGDSTASKDSDSSADSEDDDFLSEDTDKAASSEEPLAEEDLEKELDKGKSDLAGAEKAAPPVAAAPAPAPVVEEPVAAAPVAKPPVDGMITSKESSPSDDNFEYINPAPSLPKDDLGVSDPLVSEVDPPLPSLKAAQELVPISKIPKEPFIRNERIMNGVYIARPGDDLGTISQKIYNEDKTAALIADNPKVTQGIGPGFAVFYNSPNRPDDKKALLTYYEDNKMSPSYYTTKQGDDIHKIGRRVLGYEDAWKEVWAVNESLQSQALLPEGLKIRYWSGNEAKNGAVASTDDPLSATAGLTETASAPKTPEPVAEAPIDIPGPPAEYTESTVPEDPSMAGSGTQTAAEPPPILPDASGTSPNITPAAQPEGSLGTVAGIALVVLAVIALIAMQIKNRKKSDAGLPPSLEFTKV